jgi:hypothetical protein
MRNWEYLRNFPEGACRTAKTTPSVQLRHGNVALMVIVDELHALRVHERRPANLRHGGQHKVSSFFMQLTVEDLRALRMPPCMEQVTERFKVKKGGQPVNTLIYLGKWC